MSSVQVPQRHASEPSPHRLRPLSRRAELVYLGVFFVAFTVLAFLFPASGDDWAWGTRIGTDRLHTHFRDYNGRYAGDLAVLVLTRTTWLTPLVMAAVLALTIWLVLDLTDNRTSVGYPAAILLFLLMPQGVWRESVAWVSGFSNYAFAALAVLAFLWLAKGEWLAGEDVRAAGRHAAAGPRALGTVLRLLAIALLSLVAQLFMETATIYLGVAAVLFCLAYAVRFRAVPWRVGTATAGFVVGAIVMFSNGAYSTAAGSGTGYQQISHSGLKDKFSRLFDVISNLAVDQNAFLNVVLVLLLVVLVGVAGERVGRAARATVVVAAAAFLTLSTALRIAEDHLSVRLLWRCFAGVGAVLLLLSLCVAAFTVFADRRRGVGVVVVCVSVVLYAGPLTVANPIGPRNFYQTYLFFVLIASLLLRELADRATIRFASIVGPGIAVAAVAAFGSYLMIYGVIHHAAERRLDYVHQRIAAGATHVSVKALPFSGYVHDPDPRNSVLAYRFKLYYDLPGDLRVTMKRPASR